MLWRLRETQRERGPQLRKKRMVMVMGNLKGRNDVGLRDAPYAGSRLGAFELGARFLQIGSAVGGRMWA